jgi:hypothetical protein
MKRYGKSDLEKGIAKKVESRHQAPKGASYFEELTAWLKRCPDTNP